jgi:ADP-ribosylation factor GTPase-activating protein 2/3
VITDAASNAATDGTSTPAGEPDDDFFSSWDKPAIKRPTPPIRTATPPTVGRTPSPFLNANGGNANGGSIARTASPLAGGESSAAPASRVTSSAALRKSAAAGSGPRKANVLGAKKTKLGAKKVTGDVIDFDAAEKKAKEEAERIAELGYDPDAADAPKKTVAKVEETKIASPTPTSPGRAGYGNQKHERSTSEVERLGMGMGRLGFGQIGGARGTAPAAKKMGGFGSVGPIKSSQEGKL